MANLNGFDANKVEPTTDFEAIPALAFPKTIDPEPVAVAVQRKGGA